jgi:NAD(P)H-hydrate epimerase
MSRLTGRGAQEVLNERYDIGLALARDVGAAVLLKGVPTIVTSPSGRRLVSAAGSPALATAGSGDLLAGIAATLVTQGLDPATAGACAAWVHGTAAEHASLSGIRGVSLDAIAESIVGAWQSRAARPRYPVLAELPAIYPRES